MNMHPCRSGHIVGAVGVEREGQLGGNYALKIGRHHIRKTEAVGGVHVVLGLIGVTLARPEAWEVTLGDPGHDAS